nr:alpha/beta hydrolase [Corynebacterium lactis]
MKKFLKVLGIIVAVIVLTAVAVAGIHAYNVRRYAIPGPNLQDKSIYATNEQIRPIEGHYANGFHFVPEQKRHEGAVVVFGGSEGSPDYERARQLFDAGYEVFALFFFGQPNQQKELVDVPLEFFDEVRGMLPDGPVTVIGSSKGAELAANLAVHRRGVDHLVLFTPAEYTYQGLSFSGGPSSSFTLDGQPLPFLQFQDPAPAAAGTMFLNMALGLPISYRAVYASMPQHASNTEDARIKIENFHGDGLLFAGDQDAMWPGDVAAKNLAERNPRLEARIFPQAGHLFSEDITKLGPSWETMLGGTVEGNRAAKTESDRILLEKLAQWHGATALR